MAMSEKGKNTTDIQQPSTGIKEGPNQGPGDVLGLIGRHGLDGILLQLAEKTIRDPVLLKVEVHLKVSFIHGSCFPGSVLDWVAVKSRMTP